jgi:hypothetical protein
MGAMNDRVLLFIPPRAFVAELKKAPVDRPKGESTAADHLYWPTPQVSAYYDVAFNTKRPPHFDEFWERYIQLNDADYKKAQPFVRQAMKVRGWHHYCSQIREHYLFGQCVELTVFDSVVKHEALDLNSNVDLIVTKNDVTLGIALHTPTRNSQHWDQNIKPYRVKEDQHFGGAFLDVTWSFDEAVYIGGVYLPNPVLSERIKSHVFGLIAPEQGTLGGLQ